MPFKPSPSPITSPSADVSPLLAGLNSSNLIVGGEGNTIFNSRRCSLINTNNLKLGKAYNRHVVGSEYEMQSPGLNSNQMLLNNNFNNNLADDWDVPNSYNAYIFWGNLTLKYGGSISQIVESSINQTYKLSITLKSNYARGLRVKVSDSDNSSNIFFDEILKPSSSQTVFELRFSSKSRYMKIEFLNVQSEYYMTTIENVSLFSYKNGYSHQMYVFAELESNGDVSAFSQSDRRLKDNIKPIKNCLQKILSLDAIEFDWNNLQETYSGHDVGLIAQQVEVICPEIVETRQNGFKAVKYDKLVTLLVGAIKEQQDIIDEIERKITR